MAAKKKTAKKKIARKKVARKTVARKTVARKIRANPVIKDHLIVAQLRPEREAEALKKKINVARSVYFDGAAWVGNRDNAARYHNKTHAVKIAQLIADQDMHGNRFRQLAVMVDKQHPK